MHDLLKLNLGSGQNKQPGYINVDKCGDPDVRHDLEIFPWPWGENSVGEVILCHVLEHLGERTDLYFGIIKELYRICSAGAKIYIDVPHPRHNHFLDDPSHVRTITPDGLNLFSKTKNQEWKTKGVSNSPLGVTLNVDFELVETTFNLDPEWAAKLQSGELSETEIYGAMKKYNNVVMSTHMVLQVLK